MVKVTFVVPAPAAIVGGENEATAPGGKPVAVKLTAPGNVDPPSGLNDKA